MKTNADCIGKSVLVGLRHLDGQGKQASFEDFFGVVESSDDEAGVVLKRPRDGATHIMPHIDLAEFPPTHQSYGIVSEDEKVNPDYVVFFDLHPPDKK